MTTKPAESRANNKALFIVLAIIAIVAVVILTALFIPQDTNGAYAAAIAFVNAAGNGDDSGAEANLSAPLLVYVADNCPQSSVSACIRDYTPNEWGEFLNAVFRRAQPDGDAWDILLLATYEEGQGFSGICIYTRAEQLAGKWQITAWSGWVSCDLPNAGLSSLAMSDAPNYVP